jgi:hypothetical protein
VQRIIDIGAAVFGLATWAIPLLLIAIQKPRSSSLAAVGHAIGILMVAVCLSAIGLSLALVSLVFAKADWAWPSLMAISAFWLLVGVLIYVGHRRRSPPNGPHC